MNKNFFLVGGLRGAGYLPCEEIECSNCDFSSPVELGYNEHHFIKHLAITYHICLPPQCYNTMYFCVYCNNDHCTDEHLTHPAGFNMAALHCTQYGYLCVLSVLQTENDHFLTAAHVYFRPMNPAVNKEKPQCLYTSSNMCDYKL